MGIAITVKFKRGIQGSRFNWLVILPVWLSCAFLGFVLMSLYINPAARLFFKLDYWKAILQFEESLRLVHTEYVDPNKSDLFQLSTQAVNGMLEGLDRHSRFFDSNEYKVFNDQTYILELGMVADLSIVKAWKGDAQGNLVYRKTARNFNPNAATCGKICVAEVEEIVSVGALDPDEIHTPGIFVDRIFQGEYYEKKIENLTNRDH